MNDYQYEYDWDSKYCYPNSFTLINKLGIQDAKALNEAEREITAMRVSQIKENPCKGDFDLKHLQAIHRFLFHDVYSWAGQLRTVNISKGNQFCNCMYIESGSKLVFDKLKQEDRYLIGTPTDVIGEKLAYYLGEINVIHPFREGNGRTQRVFIESLARIAGYQVDFTNVSGREMIEASADAFNCDYRKMTDLFQRITSPISSIEQEEYIRLVMPKGASFLKIYHESSEYQ
ncbi:Fic/DOC family protein [Caproiciproducens sp. CPB-2]|uniref:Fic/DOC family protein n=1 Tax=unclassified Caproiciproducens TaxID=2643836 RepID=UPI0023DC530C|nr:Fic family protein [Caproiciproducens sp. CPB-2]MDF1493952.1 Fic family protein [Caproiciproducens sp. CPB-2]